MRYSRRSGFTLIEITIAFALLATIVGITLGTLQSTARPVTTTTVQADMAVRGTTAMNELIFALEGSGGGTQSIGTYAAGTFTDSGASNEAIEFQRVFDVDGDGEIWDVSTDLTELEAESVFFFEADESFANGWAKAKLVRVLSTGQEITILKDIYLSGAGGSPAVPRFTLSAELVDLTINFTMIKRVDIDLYARVDFTRSVNLRNNNQPNQ